MFQNARARWRDASQVRKLGRNLAWEGAKLVAFLALREGVKRLLGGPLEVQIRVPPFLRAGEPFAADVTVTSPYPLTRFEVFFEDRWRQGDRIATGRRTEHLRLIPHAVGLRPISVAVEDVEGHRLRRTRWVPVIPGSLFPGLPASPIDVTREDG